MCTDRQKRGKHLRKLLVYEALSNLKLLVYEALSDLKLLVYEALSYVCALTDRSVANTYVGKCQERAYRQYRSLSY